jgi:hypothetical protein
MGLFDRFKKDKSDYDVTNMKVTDLDKGFIFEYDLKTWIVEEVYKYDWGDEFFSFEYKVSCENDTKFLSVEEDDELELIMSEKVTIRKIHEDLPELLAAENPPKKLTFEGKEFYLEEESPGYFSNQTKDKKTWVEFICWDYLDEKEKEVISVEQWGENEFEASKGLIIKPIDISNIIPAES